MILKNENSIYMFYEAIEQLEPEKILDVGMFLKRTGAVSRKVMSRDIPEDRQLTGIDFFPELTFPVWNMIYDQIETAESYYKKRTILQLYLELRIFRKKYLWIKL